MSKNKDYKPKGAIQILAAIGLLLAILWTAKGFFDFGKAGYKEIKSSKSNSETQKVVIVDLNCRWLSGESYLSDGTRMTNSSGMPGTHDIVISLMPSKNRIMKFEEFGGHQASIKIFNQSEIYWEFDSSEATWDYRLSRMSGSLKTGWYRKSNGGRIFNSYQCSKSEQKF